ncbi:hypothetical protein GPECTOR_10g973 [Gonium pectorale]|uniref:Uncharacterized protein n=1 Tax=Gonium pectorale TaxID=33097 RepID=A0A150GRA3_GONPE|nr:hypothetical protein GPECTOR_10g973 [Gonium pectorale]|eukprot:KXZ52341.1 hypothetical protein GPECTOR_10g973 [Gonium pectorale]
MVVYRHTGSLVRVWERARAWNDACDEAVLAPRAVAWEAHVCADDLQADPAALRARLRGRGLWGWFQFQTSRYAAHAPAVRALWALRPELREALDGALLAVLAARPAALAGSSSVHCDLRDSPPFEVDGQQGHAWRDKSGVDFRVPLDWYGAALADLPYDPDRDLLWICTDDPQLAARAELCGVRGTSWAAEAALAAAAASADEGPPQRENAHGDSDEWRAGESLTAGVETLWESPPSPPSEDSPQPSTSGPAQHSGSRLRSVGSTSQGPAELLRLVSEHALLADWFVMRRADVLLASNSTLSFTAAMLNEPAAGREEGLVQGVDAAAWGAEGAEERRGAEERGEGPVLLRPDPALRGLRRFDPWAELPLLPSAPVAANHSVNRGSQEGRRLSGEATACMRAGARAAGVP